MGVDLNIWINKKDIPKLLDLQAKDFMFWDDFYFLRDFGIIRWYRFLDIFGIEEPTYEPLTSKQILEHLAKSNKKIKDRERWVEILNKYDLVFAPDTKHKEIAKKEYIEILDLENRIQKLVKQHFEEVVK